MFLWYEVSACTRGLLQITLTEDQPVTVLGSEPGEYDSIPDENLNGAKKIRRGTKVRS